MQVASFLVTILRPRFSYEFKQTGYKSIKYHRKLKNYTFLKTSFSVLFNSKAKKINLDVIAHFTGERTSKNERFFNFFFQKNLFDTLATPCPAKMGYAMNITQLV